MKAKVIAAILFAALVSFVAPRPAKATWSVSITYFQGELAPYGRWVSTASYGDLWCPRVAAGWAPYTYGEWVWTDYGWTWVSYDPFGEDPFHYGTWVWVDPYGWCWDPGYVWGPAWVTWAYTDVYIGWAPLPPTFVFTTSGYVGAPITVSTAQYVFVPTTSFVGANVSTVRVPTTQNATILSSAQRVTRFSVSNGFVRAADPPASLVEKATGKSLRKTSLSAHKITAAPITASRAISGKRVAITAPKQDRAIAMKKESKPANAKVASEKTTNAKPTSGKATSHKASTSAGKTASVKEKPSSHKAPAHTESVEKHAAHNAAPARAPSSGHEAKPSHRHEAAAPPAPRIAERHERPAPARHEQGAPAVHQAPPERVERAKPAHPAASAQAPPQGPPPQAHAPQGGPPPQAAKPPEHQPPPQAQGKGEKKPKQQ